MNKVHDPFIGINHRHLDSSDRTLPRVNVVRPPRAPRWAALRCRPQCCGQKHCPECVLRFGTNVVTRLESDWLHLNRFRWLTVDLAANAFGKFRCLVFPVCGSRRNNTLANESHLLHFYPSKGEGAMGVPTQPGWTGLGTTCIIVHTSPNRGSVCIFSQA